MRKIAFTIAAFLCSVSLMAQGGKQELTAHDVVLQGDTLCSITADFAEDTHTLILSSSIGFHHVGEFAWIQSLRHVGRISGVELRGDVVSVQHGAFDIGLPDATPLRKVVLNEGLRCIGSRAFAGQSIDSLCIPSSVDSVCPEAFEYNNVSCLRFGLSDGRSNLKKIGYMAFCNNKLDFLETPPSLEVIGAQAFEGHSLRSLILNEGLLSIGFEAFANVRVYDAEETEDVWTWGGEFPFVSIPSSGCSTLRLPSSLQSIGQNAFCRCLFIDTLLFDPSAKLKSIAPFAFQRCYVLRHVSLPSGLIEVGDGAFRRCLNLTSARLPDGLLRIGHRAFSQCSLDSVVVPSSVTEWCSSAFSNMRGGVSSITVCEGIREIPDSAFCRENADAGLLDVRCALCLPSTLKRIGRYAFWQFSLEDTPLPSADENGRAVAWDAYDGSGNLVLQNVEYIGGNRGPMSVFSTYEYRARLANEEALPVLKRQDVSSLSYTLDGRPATNVTRGLVVGSSGLQLK